MDHTANLDDAGWVYLVKSGDLFKIGYTQKLQTRMRKLMTGAPLGIFLVHVLRTIFYKEIEETLHLRFHHKRLNGEWFALDEDDVAYIKELDWRGYDAAKQEQCRVANERRANMTDEEKAAVTAKLNQAFAGFSECLSDFVEDMKQRVAARQQNQLAP